MCKRPGCPKDLWMSGDLDVLGPGCPKDLDVRRPGCPGPRCLCVTWMSVCLMGGRRPDMPNKVPVFSHLIIYCNYDYIHLLSQIEPCDSNDISPLLWGGWESTDKKECIYQQSSQAGTQFNLQLQGTYLGQRPPGIFYVPSPSWKWICKTFSSWCWSSSSFSSSLSCSCSCSLSSFYPF